LLSFFLDFFKGQIPHIMFYAHNNCVFKFKIQLSSMCVKLYILKFELNYWLRWYLVVQTKICRCQFNTKYEKCSWTKLSEFFSRKNWTPLLLPASDRPGILYSILVGLYLLTFYTIDCHSRIMLKILLKEVTLITEFFILEMIVIYK
jgi:hypothetical protein